MPAWDGAGNFTVTHDFTDDRDTGVKILASRMDQNMADIVAGINNCVTRDGQNAASDSVDMGSNKIINLADGVDANDAVNLGQLQASVGDYNIWIVQQVFG